MATPSASLATPQPGATSLVTPSAAKRTVGDGELQAPASKRQSVDTPTDLERRRLRDEAWEAKHEVQEVRARCERESQAARLALLEEKQHVKELELQRDFLSASEARLREQTAELRSLLQSEQDARQREEESVAAAQSISERDAQVTALGGQARVPQADLAPISRRSRADPAPTSRRPRADLGPRALTRRAASLAGVCADGTHRASQSQRAGQAFFK